MTRCVVPQIASDGSRMSDVKLANLLSGADADDVSEDEEGTAPPKRQGALSAFARSTTKFHSAATSELDDCHAKLTASLISRVKSIAPFMLAARLAPDLTSEVASATLASKAILRSLGDAMSEEHKEAHREEVKAQVTPHRLNTTRAPRSICLCLCRLCSCRWRASRAR